jgi:putative oxidoreductase
MSLALGLLIARLVIGLTLAAHGAQKLFGWFDGPGFAKFSAGMSKQGLNPGWLWVSMACLGEFGGGLSLAAGFLTPLGAAGIFAAMLMAMIKVHWKNGFWNGKRGIEYTLALLAVSVELGLAGPGQYSLDALFGTTLPHSALIFAALAVASIIVDSIGIFTSRKAAAPTPAPAPAQAEPRPS